MLSTTSIGGRQFRWGERTYVMGVINVTPDSFSGDGLGYEVDAAIEQALRFEAEGADILDVGGESTRPPGRIYGKGATHLSEEEELRRVIPTIERITKEAKIPVSIDTYKASVALRALEAGAAMVNDVWALQADPFMAEVVANAKVAVVLMHNQPGTRYENLIPNVISGLDERMKTALKAGIPEKNIILDPGIGFGKNPGQNVEILQRFDALKVLGRPLLVGTSRKSVIGEVLGLPVDQRLEGTAATIALAIAKGVDMVRVHDVREIVRVVRMSDAIVRGWNPSR
ncbi:MAG: dihydropteroate synthase [Chloroflexi bacterium]|nr:dihydropteroate synthase [Chloroflexota bacterium]